MDVQLESFKNPVTGEEQDTKIQIPKGFIWKLAEGSKVKNYADLYIKSKL